MYSITWGKQEKFLVAAAKEMNNPPPKFYQNKPRLSIYENFIWRAYCELSTNRGDKYIPWRVLHDYTEIHVSIHGSTEYENFFNVIRLIEDEHLEDMQRKADLETENTANQIKES